MDAEKILCPSAPCHEGAILVGIVMPDGRVAFASDRVVVDGEFVQIARQGRSPESRFRFGSACAKSGCAQWTGERCGVIDSVLEAAPGEAGASELPECSIRHQCRWFNQRGAAACAVCPEVLTDMREDLEEHATTTAALTT
jgi:hypothetical protein